MVATAREQQVRATLDAYLVTARARDGRTAAA